MQLLKVRAHFTGLLKHAGWPRRLYVVLEGQGMGLLIQQFSPPLGFAFREVHFLHTGWGGACCTGDGRMLLHGFAESLEEENREKLARASVWLSPSCTDIRRAGSMGHRGT